MLYFLGTIFRHLATAVGAFLLTLGGQSATVATSSSNPVESGIATTQSQAISFNVASATPVKGKEANIADAVASYYESTATGPVATELEMMSMTSGELDRYIQGIPTVESNFKAMSLLAYSPESANRVNDLLTKWGQNYLGAFNQEKERVGANYAALKKSQALMLQVSANLRKQYIPLSQAAIYRNDIDNFNQQIKAQLDTMQSAQSSLAGRFIAEKDSINESIYTAGMISLNSRLQISSLPEYQVPIISAPTYRPPITTYCQNFETSISCTSYQ